MDELDPRHGTYAGYAEHYKTDRDPCPSCRAAGNRRRKLNDYLATTGNAASVPSVGLIRRVRALMAIGHTLSHIAQEAGLNVKTVRNPLYRGGTVYRATHEAVAGAYERMAMRLPAEETSQQKRDAAYVRNLARRRGWAPPLAWDDIDTDDRPRGLRDRSTAEDRAATIRELVDAGANASEACRVLGIKRDALLQWCRNHDLRDEYRALASREGDWNSNARRNDGRYDREAIA